MGLDGFSFGEFGKRGLVRERSIMPCVSREELTVWEKHDEKS